MVSPWQWTLFNSYFPSFYKCFKPKGRVPNIWSHPVWWNLKLRNQVQFEDRSLSFDVSKIWRTFVEFKILESLMGLLWVLVLQSRAGPPSRFAVKLNVAAAVGSKFSSIDMIARDWRWELVFSCSHKSNTVLPLQAEAEEIKMALSLVPKIEVESIPIEADSKIYHEALLILSTLLLGD